MLPSTHRDLLLKYISSHKGQPLDPRALAQPNELVKKIMIARFLSMTPQQQQSLRAIVTPQTRDALQILLPGLPQMFERKT
jgi:hypothetical protein